MLRSNRTQDQEASARAQKGILGQQEVGARVRFVPRSDETFADEAAEAQFPS